MHYPDDPHHARAVAFHQRRIRLGKAAIAVLVLSAVALLMVAEALPLWAQVVAGALILGAGVWAVDYIRAQEQWIRGARDQL